MPLTWFEKQYGEIPATDLAELQSKIVRLAINLFDELNFEGPLTFVDGPVRQDEEFSVWTASAGKEFMELMAYCRALRTHYDACANKIEGGA